MRVRKQKPAARYTWAARQPRRLSPHEHREEASGGSQFGNGFSEMEFCGIYLAAALTLAAWFGFVEMVVEIGAALTGRAFIWGELVPGSHG